MGYVFLGICVGLLSVIGTALVGNITLGQGVLMYWIVGTVTPLLHMVLIPPPGEEEAIPYRH